MNSQNRFSAFIAYLLPVVGWLFVVLFQRKNSLAMFHLRQAIGIFFFIIAAFAGWLVTGWVLSWIPYGTLVSVALFSMVILAAVFALVAWVIGMVYALQGRLVLLPFFGKLADRLPF